MPDGVFRSLEGLIQRERPKLVNLISQMDPSQLVSVVFDGPKVKSRGKKGSRSRSAPLEVLGVFFLFLGLPV